MANVDSLVRDLNPAQKEAVLTTEGPLLVLAGAGTGKTRVITYRITHLLRRGVPPESILAVTFTNKAAREMRERVAKLAGSRPKGLTISTFHALGVRILRAETGLAGLRPGFTIADASDQVSLIRTVLRESTGLAPGIDPKAVLAAISRAKNRFELPEDLAGRAADDWDRLVAHAYEDYQAGLRERNTVDFDDLILLPVLCLARDEAVSRKYRARYRYILVDEYQDTNGSQYHFLRGLVGPGQNVCVVGDDDQSIYGFRGAEMDKILGFERDFPGARVVKLEENYRSTASILGLANAVIAGNTARREKVLRSTLGPGEPVRCLSIPDEHAEVDAVVRRIVKLLEEEKTPATSIAVLMRAAIQARPFEEKLRLRKIPYTLVGGQSYFDRKEVRDVLAYWKVCVNPKDELSLLRILNTPRRGFGDVSIQKLDGMARAESIGLLEAIGRAAGGQGDITPSVRQACGAVRDLFARARERLERKAVEEMARQVLEESCYREAVNGLYPDPLTRQARWNAVEDLIRSVERWRCENLEAPFEEFLESVALDADDREDEESRLRGIVLMTLHSAKGLEFPHVFLVGVEEDLLPHKRSQADGDHAIDEERRLFYVGITRARTSLTVTHASTRTLYGEPRPRLPSRFLVEVAQQGLYEVESYDPGVEASETDVEDFLGQYRRIRGK